MIYLFGEGSDVSIVYDESTLTEKDKTNGYPVQKLPPQEYREGYNSFLIKDGNNIYWEYQKINLEE
jgi:hypothetical protein